MNFEKIMISAKAFGESEVKEAYTEDVRVLTERGITVSCAESCTGGLIGKLFTDVSGASAVFAGGMITYTNNVKINKLGVSANTVDTYTEVSAECAAEMAVRTREYFDTDIGISATGFAGPTGGNENDPVGTVYLGISSKARTVVYRLSFDSCNRNEIRYGTAFEAVKAIIYEKTTFF
jgi:PncC family amidohydrolase